jgi:arylsulfatase A-like enzyme
MNQRRPNVVLITTDQQRYDSVGFNGSSFMHTPNMDRLGREGASFHKAYCPNTVCTPSRASIMTGLHLSRHGAYNIGTSALDHTIFLSHILRDEGYRTHHIGKAHWYAWQTDNPETRAPDEEGTPFQDFVGFHEAEISVGHAGPWGASGHYARWLEKKGIDAKEYEVHPLFKGDHNGTADWDLPKEYHSGSWVADRAVHFLRNQQPDRPFYLNIGFQDPHHPHVLPADFTNRIDPETIPMPEIDISQETNLVEHIPHFHRGTINDTRFRGEFGMAGNQNTAWEAYFQDEQKARATRAYYYSMTQLMDEQLGAILTALDELGFSDNTIVIFTSDHGEMLGDHSIGQKGPLIYEGVTRVPLFIRYPHGFAPCRVEECVSLVDLAPTILDFAGLEHPLRKDGDSLKDRLQLGQPLLRNGVRIEYKEEPDRIRFKCWVTPEWKLAVYLGENFGELYDLRNDPGEKHNLFNDPSSQEVKNRLLIELLNDMERSEPVYTDRTSRV